MYNQGQEVNHVWNRRALIPVENKRNFLEGSTDIIERVDPIFYGDPLSAAMKALGIN